ncbi:serine/threonine-protein kinase [Actinomadura harenae]|nr:serine/threonine-protein kinase [Actinomadura harenae]
MAEALPLQPGDPERLGDFSITGRIGVGEQGAVFVGRDASGRSVAVKLLHVRLSGEPDARTRFVDAFAAARRVSGFCTAGVLAADVEGDRAFVASDLVDGPSLAELVAAEGPRGPVVVERLAVGLAVSLAAAHRAGAVHHDLKPANVLLAQAGPRMTDLGVVTALDAVSAGSGTRAEDGPSFLAPEQLSGHGIGPAADVFAWATTLLFAAAGEPPFGEGSPAEIMQRIVYDDPSTDALPESVRDVVADALDKSPSERPTAADLLRRMLDGPLAARTPAPLRAEAEALATGSSESAPAPTATPSLGAGGAASGTALDGTFVSAPPAGAGLGGGAPQSVSGPAGDGPLSTPGGGVGLSGGAPHVASGDGGSASASGVASSGAWQPAGAPRALSGGVAGSFGGGPSGAGLGGGSSASVTGGGAPGSVARVLASASGAWTPGGGASAVGDGGPSTMLDLPKPSAGDGGAASGDDGGPSTVLDMRAAPAAGGPPVPSAPRPPEGWRSSRATARDLPVSVGAAGVASEGSLIPGMRPAEDRGSETAVLSLPGLRAAKPRWRRPGNHVVGVAVSLAAGVLVGVAIIALVLWPQLRGDGGGSKPSGHGGADGKPVSTIPDTFAGTWKGTAVNAQRGESFPLQVTLQAGAKTGTAVYPKEGCTGTLALTKGTGAELQLALSVSQPCTSGDVRISRQPDGSLKYDWSKPGTALAYRGSLTKG